jgi:ubiquinone biosynthesis protein COQ9
MKISQLLDTRRAVATSTLHVFAERTASRAIGTRRQKTTRNDSKTADQMIRWASTSHAGTDLTALK